MKKRLLSLAAVGAIGVLGLTACASGDTGAATENNSNTSADGKLENGDLKDLTIAVFNGWPEGEAASFIWKEILEDKGYNVKLEYADAGPVFAGVSTGDYDVVFDGWLPQTHADYMEEYGDDLTDLGSWNDDAILTLAVNEDAPIDSIEELAANADKFGNRIVGIEQGAGLTKATQDKVIPGYGLDGMDFITSSTPAMLAELQTAVDQGENIVVTLWRPHWAYDEFPIKDLKDPKGTLGEAEGIHTIAKKDFESDYPTLAGWIKNFKLDSERLFSLENVMFNSGAEIDDYTPVVQKWMSENQEYVDSLTS